MFTPRCELPVGGGEYLDGAAGVGRVAVDCAFISGPGIPGASGRFMSAGARC